MEELFKWAGALGSIATAIGVLLAWWQVRRNAQQARTDFEDDLAREYRELARGIPTSALLGGALEPEEEKASFSLFHRYIDLSNEQVFLRMNGRVSKETWVYWCEGIESNLARQAFKKAWDEIKVKAPESFKELRRLERSNFKDDPNDWK